MLIVPRKRIWTQQPQGAAKLDTSSLKILFSAPLAGDGGVDLTSDKFATIVGSPAVEANSLGVSTRFGAGKRVVFPALSGILATTPVTIIWTQEGIGASGYVATAEIGYGGSSSFLIYNSTATLDYGTSCGSALGNAKFTSAGILLNGEQNKFALLCVGGLGGASGTYTLYKNGVRHAGAATSIGQLNSAAIEIGSRTSGVEPFSGRIGNFAILLGASEVTAKSLSENPWQIFRAPDSRIFVPTGAGAGSGDSLTASSIIASPATVGSPILSQKHALSASSIITAPAVVASPTIAQRHALSATAVSVSPAVVGSPSITQRHALTATAISAAPAIVGSPTLTEIVAGILSALPIVSAPAVVGAPAITQKHALSAGAISAGPATFGTPTLAQQHALMAHGVTAAAAVVGAPALSEGGAAPFTAEQILYLEANYVTIANISDIAAAVLAALQSTAIPVNIKQVNDVTIKGIGTQSNPWNPV